MLCIYVHNTHTKTYESTLDYTHNSKRVHVSTVAHAHKPKRHPYSNAKHIYAHNPNGTFVIPILTIEAERKKNSHRIQNCWHGYDMRSHDFFAPFSMRFGSVWFALSLHANRKPYLLCLHLTAHRAPVGTSCNSAAISIAFVIM